MMQLQETRQELRRDAIAGPSSLRGFTWTTAKTLPTPICFRHCLLGPEHCAQKLHKSACSPSSVARACDPSGGINVVGHGSGSCGLGLVRLSSGPPVPSRELIHAGRAKAWAAWILKRRGPRQAGFTEQRRPPAPGSGRITGRRRSGPTRPNGLDPLNHHFFFLKVQKEKGQNDQNYSKRAVITSIAKGEHNPVAAGAKDTLWQNTARTPQREVEGAAAQARVLGRPRATAPKGNSWRWGADGYQEKSEMQEHIQETNIFPIKKSDHGGGKGGLDLHLAMGKGLVELCSSRVEKLRADRTE
ncbi:hypothetical protein NL676_011915 [Syzygium grande]|nr:hypothetical protein NL676_011915 [Syzygium grande]